jgi:DNA-binding transcriptional LysR family regulator
MELRRLRYFLRIAAEGSLGRASRAIGIAQPALSRQMQLLESELGVQLFQRVTTGMRLTEEGDYLREAISHPLHQIDIALQGVRSFSARVETTCTLGLPPPISRLLGPGMIRRLQTELPNLQLHIVEDHSSRLAAALLRETMDVAILTGFTPDDRLFHAEMLSEPLLLVGSAQSNLVGKDAIAFGELEHFPLILPSAPAILPVTLEKLAARTAAKISAVLEVDSLDLTKELVKSGAGYAILPLVAFKDEAKAGELISARVIDPDLSQSVHYAVQAHWRIPRSTYNKFHRAFYEVWMEAVDNGDWPATWLFDRDEIAQSFG